MPNSFDAPTPPIISLRIAARGSRERLYCSKRATCSSVATAAYSAYISVCEFRDSRSPPPPLEPLLVDRVLGVVRLGTRTPALGVVVVGGGARRGDEVLLLRHA